VLFSLLAETTSTYYLAAATAWRGVGKYCITVTLVVSCITAGACMVGCLQLTQAVQDISYVVACFGVLWAAVSLFVAGAQTWDGWAGPLIVRPTAS